MNNYWIKYYADNSKLIGDDKVSWSNTKLDNMTCCELYYNHYTLGIKGLSNDYWQSDTYETVYPYNKSKLTAKRIEKKITDRNRYIWFQTTINKLYLFTDRYPEQFDEVYIVQPEWINKYLICEIDLNSKRLKWHISENKI